jgi:hypothetical protein
MGFPDGCQLTPVPWRGSTWSARSASARGPTTLRHARPGVARCRRSLVIAGGFVPPDPLDSATGTGVAVAGIPDSKVAGGRADDQQVAV